MGVTCKEPLGAWCKCDCRSSPEPFLEQRSVCPGPGKGLELPFRVQGLGFKVATRVADARLQWWGFVVAATFKGAPHEPEEGLWPPSPG